MSPRLRSNWRPPARQQGAENPAAQEPSVEQPADTPALPAGEVPAIPEAEESAANAAVAEPLSVESPPAARSRVRRTPVRARPQAAAEEQPEGAPVGDTAAKMPAHEGSARRRQPARRRAATVSEAGAPQQEPEPTLSPELGPEPALPAAPSEPAPPHGGFEFAQEFPADLAPPSASAIESPSIPDEPRYGLDRDEEPAVYSSAPESTVARDEAQPAWEGEFLAQAREDGQQAWAATLAGAPGEVTEAAEAAVPSETEALEQTAEELDESEPARAHRRRGQRGRRGRGTRPLTQTEVAEPSAEPEAAIPVPMNTATEFEPLPPPTKRKAPRVIPGMRQQRPPVDAENAVDWALGRTPAPEAPAAPADEVEIGVAARRRRSRRGRGGRAVSNGTPPVEPQESEALVSEEQFMNAQQRRQQAPPPREDRGRSQLSTFESLVARQNVVLDTLLARVSSFASIERALTAVEQRLSSQGFGAAGTAAPRVGIFVDVPNIIYAAERMGVTIDFGKLLRLLTHGRELVRASAYSPISDDPMQRLEIQKFVHPFVRGGYRIVTKPLKRFSDGTMKGNFDVELAIDVLTMAERLDVVSLVSGDGDFSRLVDIVGSKGVRVEVAAFGGSTSAELRAICDDYIDLTNILPDIT